MNSENTGNASVNDGSIRTSQGFLTLSQASKILPRNNGRRIHSSTLWRWARRGCKGVHLHYVRVGRSIMVTEDGLHRFFTELAKLDVQQSHLSKPKRRKRHRHFDSHRQRAIQESKNILRKAKILV